MRPWRILSAAGLVAAAVTVGLTSAHADSPTTTPSSTPIKHVVVIFNENVSFDHYFGTYPNAANPAGEPSFTPKAGTPSVNGLDTPLLVSNPNSANPARLDRSQAVTCDQGHGYGAEQSAFDGGLMDKFVEFTAGGGCTDKSIVMDYYDGNTVTGLWNLAQGFSMSDNSYSTGFGPSTPGALNLVSGQTHGSTPASGGGVENGTVIGDPDPALDDCGNGGVTMSGKNVGDLLNAHHVTWGWFQGGFRPTSVDSTTGKATCAASHVNIGGAAVRDYSAHHEPFMYYASTSNPHHLPPSSPDQIGQTDQANHQYDLVDFDTALRSHNLPAVSFLKASQYEDGHGGYSNPLDEQRFVAHAINAIESSADWSSTAIVLAYDDSDGWYDHQMSPIVSPSAAPSDALGGPGKCGSVKDPTAYPDRCGYGPRQPLLVISPWAKRNYVDSSITDQTSITKFIEDNWQLGRIGDQSLDVKAGSLGNMFNFDPNGDRARSVYLDPTTGSVLHSAPESSGGVSETPGAGGGSHHDTRNTRATTITAAPASIPVVAGTSKTRAPKLALSCGAHGAGSRVVVSCAARGSAATSGRTALRFRIVRGGSVLATARTLLHHGRAHATLHARKSLKSGRYTLRVAIARAGGASSVSRTIRLG
ncbi:MAG: plcC [Solirubrobacterales bacterium]|nr:plcC [Solirubrobacterales bacterium]